MTTVEMLNGYRAKAGRAALAEDAHLRRLAEIRARQIADRYEHAHDLPVSEVLTVGRLDAEGAVWEWLGWPLHRAVLMDGQARWAGFGSFERDGQTYWVGLIA